MNSTRMLALAAACAAVFALPAMAAITITYEDSAPTYSTTLTFDEPGGPTGVTVGDEWQASHGVTELIAGAGGGTVADHATGLGLPWLGTGNSYFGPFGIFMKFDSDLTEFSAQYWDPSGPPSPFGGGAGAFVFADGVEVGSFFFGPTFSDIGPTWLNITTDAGSTFDEVRILGYGFPADSYMDNASWNVVPEPATMALLGLGGLAVIRRRR